MFSVSFDFMVAKAGTRKQPRLAWSGFAVLHHTRHEKPDSPPRPAAVCSCGVSCCLCACLVYDLEGPRNCDSRGALHWHSARCFVVKVDVTWCAAAAAICSV